MAKKRKNKAGRKPKIGDAERQQVIAIVSTGGSLADAASIVGVTARALRLHMQKDRNFFRGVNRAAREGKLRLIEKVGTAEAWQAAAWMLERKYGREFGKKEHRTLTGADGGPIRTEGRQVVDLRNLTDDELDQFERILIAAGRRAGRPDTPLLGRN